MSYPPIDCSVHGLQPPVFVCSHIHSATDVAYSQGEDVHCEIPGEQHTSEDIRIWCRRCAQEEGLISN